MNQTPEHIDKIDWRTNNLTWTTAPFTIPGTDKVVPSGAAVIQAGVVRYGELQVGIKIPNATALFLGLSQTYHVEANYWVQKCVQHRNSSDSERLKNMDEFVFYERIMASVVFAYTALEAFVNEEVPDNFIYDDIGNKCTRRFNKEQIERELNLDTKLGDVLPKVLGVQSPKGSSLWNAYVELQKLRDRIIHMKTKDRNSQAEDPSSIWHALLSNPLPETYKTAKVMMKYFFDSKGKHPRWFQKCSF